MQMEISAPGGLENLILKRETDAPKPPGHGEITVRIHASALNYKDFFICNRPNRTADGRIPLADGSGVVSAVGEGVTEFKPGDHVISLHFPDWQDGPPQASTVLTIAGDSADGYARDAVTRPATWFTHAPKGWTHEQAATVTIAGLTAWRALITDGGLKPGDSVLLLGTGGVSIYALQLAKAMGARAIVTSSSDDKLQRAATLGADHVINYRNTPEWGMVAREMAGGDGVDHVVEVGGAGTLAQSLVAARAGGHIAVIGVLAGVAAEISASTMLLRQLRVQGLLVGSRRHQEECVRGLDALGLRPVIDRSFPLENLRDALTYLNGGGHFGKIAIAVPQ
jgi:NADPH:quinone reductase-like Zn-dependent oxidoreductase